MCGFVSQRHLDDEDYRQVTVFVEDLETEIREVNRKFPKTCVRDKAIWMEEGEAEMAYRNHSKETRKNAEIKVDFQNCSRSSECQNG